MAQPIDDKDWVKTSFMIPSHAADLVAAQRSQLSTAFTKFTDTTLGGNFAINPPPQFTRSADLKVRAPFGRSKGMGRKYSEMIDDNSQIVHMRFGVPQFNSLTTFFTGFYDSGAAMISRTGRSPGFFYNLGRVAGFVVTLPLQPLILAGKFYRFLANKPSSKFYYMKPTMPLYWSAVNTIANGIAVNMGIIPRVMANSSNQATSSRPDGEDGEVYNSGDILTDSPGYSQEDIRRYHAMLPDVFHEDGGIDIYAVASRAQRLADRARDRLEAAIESAGSPEQLRTNMQAHIQEIANLSDPGSGFKATGPNQTVQPGLQTYLAHWTNQQLATPPSGENNAGSMEKGMYAGVGEEGGDTSWLSSFVEFAEAEIRDGGQFATFRVNHTGEIGESFSNSAGESQLASALNGVSSSSRAARFSFADGNLDDSAIGNLIGGAINAATDLVRGIGDSMGISGLGALMGNAFVDIPQEWKDSTAELPKSSYTMHLRSPYGNAMSRYMNLWVPLSMLLAAALPKSTGKHSYDAPFLVELYDKGRQKVRMGIIDSIQITRGVGNIGWTRNHEPLGIDVTFSVMDLSSVLHMPINGSPGILDEDSAYTDYLAILGSLALSDQLYGLSRLKLNLTRYMTDWRQWESPAKYGQWIASTMPGQVLSAFARETARGN